VYCSSPPSLPQSCCCFPSSQVIHPHHRKGKVSSLFCRGSDILLFIDIPPYERRSGACCLSPELKRKALAFPRGVFVSANPKEYPFEPQYSSLGTSETSPLTLILTDWEFFGNSQRFFVEGCGRMAGVNAFSSRRPHTSRTVSGKTPIAKFLEQTIFPFNGR